MAYAYDANIERWLDPSDPSGGNYAGGFSGFGNLELAFKNPDGTYTLSRDTDIEGADEERMKVSVNTDGTVTPLSKWKGYSKQSDSGFIADALKVAIAAGGGMYAGGLLGGGAGAAGGAASAGEAIGGTGLTASTGAGTTLAATTGTGAGLSAVPGAGTLLAAPTGTGAGLSLGTGAGIIGSGIGSTLPAVGESLLSNAPTLGGGAPTAPTTPATTPGAPTTPATSGIPSWLTKLLENPQILGGLLGAVTGAVGSKTDEPAPYTGPMPEITRGGWQSSVTPTYSIGGFAKSLLPKPKRGEETSGLWRFLQ